MACPLVETFLARFVPEPERPDARRAMGDLFADLHCRLARDFLATYSEADEPKAPKAPKAPKVEKPPCQATTAKGEPCPKRACADSDTLCAAHLKQSQRPPKAPKAAKAPAKEPKAPAKPEKRLAEHAHAIGEPAPAGEPCELCETHGDAFDADLTEADFEGVEADMQDRLQDILKNISQLDVNDDGDEPEGEPAAFRMEESDFDDGSDEEEPEAAGSDEEEDED